MATSSRDITFVIPGQAQPTAPGSLRGSVKAAVQVGSRRAAGESVRVTARPGDDVVVLSINNGPTLVLHPEDARDLMRAQAPAAQRSGELQPSEVAVPAQLGWPGLEGQATRGWLGQAWLKTVEVITGVNKDGAADIAAALVTKALDGRVEAGVYQLAPDQLGALKGSGRKLDAVPAADAPLLVLIHGGFVDTTSTFRKLWEQHAQTVAKLFGAYGGRVYALDHPTLRESPIANALTLVQALPQGARVHLLTHSRGGLVAEVLSRACAGVSEADLARFGPAYAQHRKDLQALAQQLAAKQIRIDRVVRVACPARGTMLASTRLNAYLSVLKWGLELAHLPVVPELVDFLTEVARRRANPAMLPGLEAMMPTSPVVAWLNEAQGPIAGQLRVVAGDIEGDSITSWVKTLLSDAFYWTDNDLVVQTRSMYGGAPRSAEGASFVLDRGGDVTHFGYFSNARTVNAVASALLDDRPADFRLIGPLSWQGEDASGTRAGRAVTRSRGPVDGVPASERPAVFVLPGILGSNLALDGERIWLGLKIVNGLKKLAWNPAEAARVTDQGPIGAVYDDLIETLAQSHEVIPFGFDWRRPLEEEAARLAARMQEALDARNASQQPVRIVAHSMGGLLARTMRLVAPSVWQRFIDRSGARLLMLGTPNGGSWAPMQTLSGDDTFGNALAAFGSLFDNDGARRVMAGMPGFLQLQASLTDPALGLSRSATWDAIAQDDMRRLRERNIWHNGDPQLAVYEWSAPPQPVLDTAVALRLKLDEQVAQLGSDAQKMLLVVGHAKFTPAGMRMGEEGLEYLDAPEAGDGRVTLDSAMLPGVKTWQVDAEHGSLPSSRSAFDAYLELLNQGSTQRLPAVAPRGAAATRGSAADATAVERPLVPNRPSRGKQSSEPPSLASDVYASGSGAAPSTTRSSPALPVCVLNGNLKFSAAPLMVGHYISTTLTGTERVVNRLIDGGMAESLQAGLYPSGVGTQQVFINTWRDPEQPLSMPRPSAVVVVGLGEEGRLRMAELTRSVRQGVIAYAQRESEREAGGSTSFELAATLIGSGGTGVSPGGAAQAIAQGVRDANRQLQRANWPQVTQLHLVELYLDRATEAQTAIAVLGAAHPGQYTLAPAVVQGVGALRRPPDSSYRGAGYDFVTVVQRYDRDQQPVIEYTLDTQRARSEVRGQSTQSKLVDELVRVGADSDNADTAIRRSLFQLLVPVEIEPFLSGSNAMVLQLDSETARFPWELLDAGGGPDRSSERYPWAVRTRLLRKLRTVEFRDNPVSSTREGGVLVLGEPQCDPDRFAALPAAREEAVRVAQALKAQPLLGPDALQAVKALLAEPWRVVHIAGHGELREKDGYGGVVLSNGTLLGPREIQAMRTVPELVFVNCCFIGRIGLTAAGKPVASSKGVSRASFAASVAEQLIRIGVRCVVAAGWAVEDEPAMVFATRFYEQLLAGERFIDAVGVARLAAYDQRPEGNTWAAYQCYGDPDWRFEARPPAGREAFPDVAIVSAPALALALETAALDAQYKDSGATAAADRRWRLEWLRQLEALHSPQWGNMGAVAEAFGLAYAHHGDLDAAIRWYQRALEAADGSASFKSAEQLGNLLSRRAGKQRDPAAAEADIAEAIDRLQRLVAVQPSAERCTLLGSAFKRRAVLLGARAQAASAAEALEAALKQYRQAEDLARRAGADNLYYPAMNAIAAELRLAFLQQRAPVLETSRWTDVRQSIQAKATQDPDFWSLAGVSELTLLEALAETRVAGAAQSVLAGWRDLAGRVSAPWLWDSVLAQTRFTLDPYMAVAGAAEQKAAAALLEALAVLAKG